MNRPYWWGASVMLLVVMPAVLLGACVLIWLDPDDRTPFFSILVNNGIGLYLLFAIPAIGISITHTRAMTKSGHPSLKRSVAIAVMLWLVLALLYLLALFGTVNRQMWTIPVLALVTGTVYGLIVGILLPRVDPSV